MSHDLLNKAGKLTGNKNKAMFALLKK